MFNSLMIQCNYTIMNKRTVFIKCLKTIGIFCNWCKEHIKGSKLTQGLSFSEKAGAAVYSICKLLIYRYSQITRENATNYINISKNKKKLCW